MQQTEFIPSNRLLLVFSIPWDINGPNNQPHIHKALSSFLEFRKTQSVLFSSSSEEHLAMKLFSLFLVCVTFEGSSGQNLEDSCMMPNDIPASRSTRLHHPCESNQNRDLAIETHEEFYCIFYSVFQISLFEAETTLEITFDSAFGHDQVDS